MPATIAAAVLTALFSSEHENHRCDGLGGLAVEDGKNLGQGRNSPS